MISSMIVALSVIAVALTFERLYLRSRKQKLRAAEQVFVFHRLRDELQLLVIEDKLNMSSRIYRSLLTMLNLGIRNGSSLRASELVRIVRSVEQPKDSLTSDDFVQHVKLHDQEVQRFVAVCYFEFAKMLLMNEPLYTAWRVSTSWIRFLVHKAWNPSFRLEVHPLLRSLFPESIEIYRTAAAYRNAGNTLRECAA